MSSLHQQIKDEIKDSLKKGERERLSVLRGLLAEITNELVREGQKPDGVLEDAAVLAVIKREVKKRQDAAEGFEKGGRNELRDKELSEKKILEPYLPETASKEEVVSVAEQKMKELGMHPDNESQKGALIGAVMKEMKGNAEGSLVKEVVDEIFGAK